MMRKVITIKEKIKGILDKLPYIRRLRKEVDTYKTLFPPGHYYSPVETKENVLNRESQIFKSNNATVEGIDLNEDEQLYLLTQIKKYFTEIPFGCNKKNGFRYYFNNGYYGFADGTFLYSLLRHFRPQKVIEVGSGFSSALILDTNQYFLDDKVKCHFIEPNPERLLLLLNENDKINHNIVDRYVQDVGSEIFMQLQANDIVFIDSSHVAKVGSDVNYLLFDILPYLNSGVLIHIHDIFYPFEYPKEWILKGRAWNECYLLRAFLQYNQQFKILLFNSFIEKHYKEWLMQNMPLSLEMSYSDIWIKDFSSLWLRKQ